MEDNNTPTPINLAIFEERLAQEIVDRPITTFNAPWHQILLRMIETSIRLRREYE